MINFPKVYQNLLSLYSNVSAILPRSLTLPPLHIFILTTFRCNIKCSMCPYTELQAGLEDGHKELELSELKGIVDQSPYFGLLTFTGGEVLVRRDFLDLMAYATSKRKCSIITNGTMLVREKANALVQMGPKHILGKGLVLIGVSLEGPEDFHDALTGVKGSFKRTTTGIQNLIEARKAGKRKYPLVNLQTVITPSSVYHLDSLYKMAGKMGLDICNFSVVNTNIYLDRLDSSREKGLGYCPRIPEGMDLIVLEKQLKTLINLSKESTVQLRFSPSGLTAEEIIRYFKGESRLENYSCTGPWSKAIIDPYGELLACPFLSVGNIKENRLMSLWRNELSSKFRERLKNEGLFEGCKACCMLTYLD